MFVTAVCVLFLIKLRWQKKKNFYDPGLFPECHPFMHYNRPEQFICHPFVKIRTFLLLIPQLNLRCYFFHSLVGLNKLFLDIYPLAFSETTLIIASLQKLVEVSFIKSTPYFIFVFRRSVGDSFSEFFLSIYIYG